MSLSFCCRKDNDLYQLLISEGIDVKHSNSAEALIRKAGQGSGILILSDNYPKADIELSDELLQMAQEKGLRLYVEYPCKLGGHRFPQPKPTIYERVIAADDFCSQLPRGTILMANDVFFLPTEQKENVHLVIGKVAGYDKIVFGLPKEMYPILYQPRENLMIATTCLSHFVTGRFAPSAYWKKLWKKLIAWLTDGEIEPRLSYELPAHTGYTKYEKLPKNYELNAAQRCYHWLNNYMVTPEDKGVSVLEGLVSKIEYTGRQRIRNGIRCDCIMETALVFALESVINNNPKAEVLSREMLHFGFSDFYFHGDKDSSEYGFLSWFKKDRIYYGDDNARALLAALCARSLTNETAWDEKILKCILANFRTSDKNGFQEHFLRGEYFDEGKDWKYYHHREKSFPSRPHFQAYVWAIFLWGYELTGYRDLLDTAKRGLKMTIERYPDGWQWTNSLTAEISRLLLPLAFLVKIEDTAEHREWLKAMSDELMKQLTDCGAVRDMFGDISKGSYPPPQSNEAYGTTEASLIQENGDPATDLLYTANFAFVGLHEAALVTGDKELKAAEDKLAQFLCRIQLRSDQHPQLDGAWLRSFDFEKWEYFGSSADIGWGAWCAETGWTNTWISAILYLRSLNRPLMTDEAKENFRQIAPDIIAEMLTE